MKWGLRFRLSRAQAVVLAVCYCAIIFFISSRPKPTEELFLPTGAIPHFIEYAGLGMLAWAVVWLGRPLPKRSRRFFAALAFCALYALSDEIHQSFVPFRSCEAADWVVDVVGSMAGILLMERLTARRIVSLRRA